MSLVAIAALLELPAILCLALLLAAAKKRCAQARAAAHGGSPDDTGRTRTRHLSPHRAAIERLKGKETARGRR